MNNRVYTLQEVFTIARQAILHAKNKIKGGSTQIENNLLSSMGYGLLKKAVEDTTCGTRAEIRSYRNPLEKDPDLIFFENVIAVTSKYQLGDCEELAIQALDYIVSYTNHHINAEVFAIKDHVILVLNRDQKSNIEDPTTWGDNAVICDPWMLKAFAAQDYRSELKNFYRKNDKNYIENFDPKMHKLERLENLDINYIRKMRTAAKLQTNFIIESNNLIAKLSEQIDYLILMKNGLVSYNKNLNGLSIHKIISQQGDDVSKLMKKILASMQSLAIEFPQSQYRNRRSILSAILEENNKSTLSMLQIQNDEISSAINSLFPGVDQTNILKLGTANNTIKLLDMAAKNAELIENAAKNSLIEVKRLINEGANINATDADGNTALICAAEQGGLEVVEYLLENGAYINYEHQGLSAFLIAAEEGHIEVVDYLLQKGAKVDTIDDYHTTALMCAAKRERLDMVKHLVQKGANIHATDDCGNTALDLATKYCCMKVAHYLEKICYNQCALPLTRMKI